MKCDVSAIAFSNVTSDIQMQYEETVLVQCDYGFRTNDSQTNYNIECLFNGIVSPIQQCNGKKVFSAN